MFSKDTRAQESGRTMTEMLGVLAIIGVLSIGGMTMGGHVVGAIKANRVVSGLQERILLAQKRRIIGQSTTFRDRRIQESILGLYPVKYQKGVTDEANYIYYGKKITVSEIPQQVCEALKDDETLRGTLSEVRGIISFNNGGEAGACQEENNEFFVLFGGRSEGKCRGVNNGCLECDDRTGEWVIDEAKDGEQIQDICHMCSNGRIVAKEKGKVVPCGNECCAMFEKCDTTYGCVPQCPANSSTEVIPGNQIGNTDCYCNEGYRVDAFQTGCRSEKICNPTCEAPLVCNDGNCVCEQDGYEYVYTATGRSSHKKICCDPELVVGDVCCNSVEYDETTGEKLCCGYNSASAGCCPEGYFAYNNTCYDCNDPRAISVIQEGYCALCPQRSHAGHKCVLECPEADQINQNNRCYCPDDKPVMSTDGKCYSCDSGIRGVWSSDSTLLLKDSGWNPEMCDVCGAAAYCGNYKCGGGYMHACADGQIGSMQNSKSHFLLKDGSEPSRTSYGTCYDCSEVDISTIKVESQCNICGGTWDGENWYTGTCTPPPEPCTDEECSSENECMRCNVETNSCENKCQSVEYLEATGAQWMDTGITITATDNFTADYVVTLAKNSTRGLIGYSPSNSGYWGITATNNYELGGSSTNIPTGERDSVVFKRTIDSTGKQFHELYINGVLAKTRDRDTGETGKFSLWAISNGSYKVSGKIYGFQMTLNGENIRDFVPVLDPDGVPAMFEQISKTLYYNSGTGSFKTNLD